MKNGCRSFLPTVLLLSTSLHVASTFLFLGRQGPNVPEQEIAMSSRRVWLTNFTNAFLCAGIAISVPEQQPALALDDDFENPDVPPSDDLYENPFIPKAPEEKSGLVVLRVAEVAQFQEKILRAVVNGDLGEDITVSPQQIDVGTQILLRNSNLGENLKLMIYNEVPKRRREEAIQNAVKVMNTLQGIRLYASEFRRPFTQMEMLAVADMYRDVKVQLNNLYEYLPDKEQDKYYGYFVAVTEYEKKIANGTYNPDIDGVLQFD
jgi:hypothetical protein